MADSPDPIGMTPPASPPPLPVARATRLRDVYDDEDDDRRPRRRPRPAPGGLGWPRTEGVLPRGKVRLACFVVLTLALVVSGALCILAVWGAASSDVAWKAVTSLAIVAGMMAGFTVLNEMFGKRVEPDDA